MKRVPYDQLRWVCRTVRDFFVVHHNREGGIDLLKVEIMTNEFDTKGVFCRYERDVFLAL